MNGLMRIVALLSLLYATTSYAVDVDEQTRRCRIEKNALSNPGHREGAECLKLRGMLNLPEPPTVNHYDDRSRRDNDNPRRVFDPQANRWCTVYPSGTMQCD
ncbi:MAG: hypothetical protein ACREVL_17625 [Solimonas sp.]